MKHDRKYTFTPNKISSKIPIDIKNLASKEKRSAKLDSRENLAAILHQTGHFPKVNITMLKNTQKTTSLRDILTKNVNNVNNINEITKTKNENVSNLSPGISPRETKKSSRASSNISRSKFNPHVEDTTHTHTTKRENFKPSVSVDKNLEREKSLPQKHFNISLVYKVGGSSGHVRKRSEGGDNFERDNIMIEKACGDKGTKTTKDSSFSSHKMYSNGNNGKGPNLEVESIEELHFIYNNLYQQNKALAIKFENLDLDVDDEVNEEGKSIYIN
jgi:hypothetical protein